MPDTTAILAQWETVCEATSGPVAFGVRPDGAMWMSIGDPLTGSHVQADWEFGQRNAAALKAGIEKMPRAIKALKVLREYVSGKNKDDTPVSILAKADRILEGRDD